MEPIPPPNAATTGLIPVPLGELFTLAAECERSGKLQQAESLLGHVLGTMPNQPDSLHLAGIVAFHPEIARIDAESHSVRCRYTTLSPQHMRSLPHTWSFG
jgi:hypothetical protein